MKANYLKEQQKKENRKLKIKKSMLDTEKKSLNRGIKG